MRVGHGAHLLDEYRNLLRSGVFNAARDDNNEESPFAQSQLRDFRERVERAIEQHTRIYPQDRDPLRADITRRFRRLYE
jgi:hypothetical protein